MRVVLKGITVEGRHGPLLELDHFSLETGECVLLAGEPGQGNTAMALVATGHLAPFSGTVTLVDDEGAEIHDKPHLRRSSAVVDLPAVSEPDDALPVGTIVAEGLALARRNASPGEPTRWLRERGWDELREDRVDGLRPALRTAILTALATERDHVRFLVLSLPDRHGGEPDEWWEIAQGYASRGYAVLVQSGRSSARDLGADLPPARGDQARRNTPVEALRTRPPAATPPPPHAAPDDDGGSTWLFGTRENGP